MKSKIPVQELSGNADIVEWSELGERMAAADPDRLRRLLFHMREIVQAQESIDEIGYRRFGGMLAWKRHLA